jgi:transcriptional regulator with XRE-family HTH domain
MGSRRRPQPVRLPAKLLLIRQSLGLSQEQMAKRLEGPRAPVYPTHISEFERGLREPSLLVLLSYCEAANVWMEALVKDSVDLPRELPSRVKHGGVLRGGSKKK